MANSKNQPSETFEKGLKIRREVLGDAYVDRALAGGSDPFGKPGQEYVSKLSEFSPELRVPGVRCEQARGTPALLLHEIRNCLNSRLAHIVQVTEVCWGSWGRPGLERKQRSLLNIGILMALNRGPELAAHTRGAINNGLTEEEISEAIRHSMIYVGVPAGVEAFKIAGKVIREMKESGEIPEKN